MIPALIIPIKSAIQIKMENEINLIQAYLENKMLNPEMGYKMNGDLFEIAKITRKEILKHSLKFIIISLILFLPLMILLIS